MTDNDILIMIQKRIDNLTKEMQDLPKGVHTILIKGIIKELNYLKHSISNPKNTLYDISGLTYPYDFKS